MQNNSTRTIAFVAAIALAASGGALLRDAYALQAQSKPSFMLNITSGKEDLHKVTMALQLAGHALDDGRDVTLFLNVRAPEFAHKNLSDTFVLRDNPPIKQMIADLMTRGAHVVVCPHCAEVMGVTEADLIPGAKLASRERLFGKLGPDAVVFTY